MGDFKQIKSDKDIEQFKGRWVVYKTDINHFKPYSVGTEEYKNHKLNNRCYALISSGKDRWLFQPPSYTGKCYTMDPLVPPKCFDKAYCLTDLYINSGELYMKEADMKDISWILHYINNDHYKVNNAIINKSSIMIHEYIKQMRLQ